MKPTACGSDRASPRERVVGGRAQKKRLKRLDALLEDLGWGVVSNEMLESHAPWHVRKRLLSEYITDEVERRQCLSIAAAHIARHRGWRNPYSKVDTLYSD